jgi:hypothetical protein
MTEHEVLIRRAAADLEPAPPPDEGTLPTPPPDEGTPPTPDPVPDDPDESSAV